MTVTEMATGFSMAEYFHRPCLEPPSPSPPPRFTHVLRLPRPNQTGRFRAPGRVCNDFSGYCDDSGACVASSDGDPLDFIISRDAIAWLLAYW